MGVDVDPPEDFLDLFLEGDKWVNSDFTLTSQSRYFLEQLFRFNSDMWERTGSSNDSIADESIKELFPWHPKEEDDSVSSINMFPKISIGGKVFDVIPVTSDHTTTGNEILICNNTIPITITFNATPDDEEEVITKRRDARVMLTSVKGIDGKTNINIITKYNSPHAIYTGEADEYSII